MNRPVRLQGTDGIRGAVGPDDDESRSDPLGAYLRTGFLTPAFVGLYARAFAEEEVSIGEEIIVGWDPRDRMGDFTEAIVDGILQAGCRPVVLGTVPTPAVSLLMIHRGANAGIMVTASHNPEGQNGLKLFLGPLATKLYPADEERLTQKIYNRSEGLSRSPFEGEPLFLESETREAFINYSCDPFNSWLPKPTPDGPLSKLLLVVDAAGGSMAGLASDVFRRLGVGEVMEVNGSDVRINEDGGVVELEQVNWVDSYGRGDTGQDLTRHAGVGALLKVADRFHPDLLSGKRWAAGAVFDGDGDRATLLLYDPLNKRVEVLNGDHAAFHMASYLSVKSPKVWRGTKYVNTVDSDPGAAIAASKLGFLPMLSAVGDKWLLWHAGLAYARARINEAGSSAELLQALEEGEGDARGLAAYLQSLSRESADSFFVPGRIPFALGSEASGHHVTLGRTDVNGHFLPVFSGNGLKAMSNTLTAIWALSQGRSVGDWIETVCYPYPMGFRKTYYAFYTNREKFSLEADAWKNIKRHLHMTCESKWGKIYQPHRLRISEDPSMLYFSLKDSKGIQQAAVFVRNSGTEEKTGVTVQGSIGEATNLAEVGETVLRSLLLDLKSGAHPCVQAEVEVLRRLEQPGFLKVGEAETEIGEEVETQRLFKDMERQGLIRMEDEIVAITDLGRWYVSNVVISSG